MTAPHGDFIVVGAGTAGSIVAAVLADTLGAHVVLIEAGEQPEPEHLRDAGREWGFPPRRLPDWGLYTGPVAAARGRTIRVPRPKVVGGSSLGYAGIAFHPTHDDVRAWRAACSGGKVPSATTVPPEPLPIRTFPRSEWSPSEVALAAAADALGYEWREDLNGSCDGVGRTPVAWDSGPVDIAARYLRLRRRGCVSLQPGATVSCVRFRGDRAVGVDFVGVRGGARHAEAGTGVVLAAGVFGSPAILLRSGIGPAEALRRLGVGCVADLPAVGANLQDHPLVVSRYRLSDSDGGRELPPFKVLLRASSGLKRPGDLHILTRTTGSRRRRTLLTLTSLMRPASSGRVSLDDAAPGAPLRIEPNYLAAREDRAALAEGIALSDDLLRQDAFRALAEPPRDARDADERIAQGLTTYHHFVGTCRMGDVAAGNAVVSSQSDVQGVRRLWIADASVIPSVPAVNPILSVIAFARHAAAAIASAR